MRRSASNRATVTCCVWSRSDCRTRALQSAIAIALAIVCVSASGLSANEDDRHAVDARDFRDAVHDREEDPTDVEVRRERLRELEDDLGVLLLARELLHRGAEAELTAYARDELDGLERLLHEVVGAC